jgi:hypothetical protein
MDRRHDWPDESATCLWDKHLSSFDPRRSSAAAAWAHFRSIWHFSDLMSAF